MCVGIRRWWCRVRGVCVGVGGWVVCGRVTRGTARGRGRTRAGALLRRWCTRTASCLLAMAHVALQVRRAWAGSFGRRGHKRAGLPSVPTRGPLRERLAPSMHWPEGTNWLWQYPCNYWVKWYMPFASGDMQSRHWLVPSALWRALPLPSGLERGSSREGRDHVTARLRLPPRVHDGAAAAAHHLAASLRRLCRCWWCARCC